jgi:hypothetical protein
MPDSHTWLYLQGKGVNMQGKTSLFLLLLGGILLALFTPISGFSQSDVLKTLKLEKAPLDISVSADGRWLFVLTDQGQILIYSANGKLNDRISVDESVDGIEVGPNEDTLFLKSRVNKTIKLVFLNFARQINLSGSPSKGADKAPVAIAVFSDFT